MRKSLLSWTAPVLRRFRTVEGLRGPRGGGQNCGRSVANPKAAQQRPHSTTLARLRKRIRIPAASGRGDLGPSESKDAEEFIPTIGALAQEAQHPEVTPTS